MQRLLASASRVIKAEERTSGKTGKCQIQLLYTIVLQPCELNKITPNQTKLNQTQPNQTTPFTVLRLWELGSVSHRSGLLLSMRFRFLICRGGTALSSAWVYPSLLCSCDKTPRQLKEEFIWLTVTLTEEGMAARVGSWLISSLHHTGSRKREREQDRLKYSYPLVMHFHQQAYVS